MKKLIIIVVMLLSVLFYTEIKSQSLLDDPYEGYIYMHHYENGDYAIEADIDGVIKYFPLKIVDGKIATINPYIIVTRPQNHYLIIYDMDLKKSWMFVFQPYHETVKGFKLE